jgi:hypothetical protein
LELVDDDVEGNELRVVLPTAGHNTAEVSRWAVRVTCVLHHPVEGFYFPSVRVPARAPGKLPITEEV